MCAEKPYEKEKDILVKQIKFDEPYLITCDVNGGWPMFFEIGKLNEEAKNELISNSIEKKTFVGLIQFRGEE